MAKNMHAKMRDVNQPYMTFTANTFAGPTEWRVLKRYQSPEKERSNNYARWLVACKSDMTFGNWEYGDCYIHDIPGAERGMDFPDE